MGDGETEVPEEEAPTKVPDEAVTPITPLPTIKTKVNSKLKIIINHIKEVQNMLIYLPMPAGPVRSTGRKVARLRTAPTRWSASGSTTWPQEHHPVHERLASLIKYT